MTIRERIDSLGGDYEWQQRLRDHVFVLVTDAIEATHHYTWGGDASPAAIKHILDAEAQTDE